MKAVLLDRPRQEWYCPNCDKTDNTPMPGPGEAHSRMHPCSGVGGLTAPMMPVGVKAKIVAVERQDYIGEDTVQLDASGRPIMALVTTRDDGQDCTVYAPLATATDEKLPIGSLREERA